MKIVIDKDIPFIKGVFEPYCEVQYLEGAQIGGRNAANADALIIRTRTRCDAATLDEASPKIIASATIGSDHIDTAYCEQKGIEVFTAKGCNARGVLQWVSASLSHMAEHQGWHPEEKTLGVIGVGSVGSLVAQYARSWGFKVFCCDPPRQRMEDNDFADLSQIAQKCNIISFHTPLIRQGIDRTFHMADSEFLGRLQAGTIILNSSRGEVIHTISLLEAILHNGLSCCIDTWENEPNIDRHLLSASQLSTPHIAGYSAQGKANATSMVVNRVAEKLQLPINEWYPVQFVKPSEAKEISWNEMQLSIKGFFDIASESKALKREPGMFEEMRNNYHYRQEYF